MLAKPRAPRGNGPAGYAALGATTTTVPTSTLRQRREVGQLLKARALPTRYVTDQHAALLTAAGIAVSYGDLLDRTLRAVSYRATQRLIHLLKDQDHAQA